MRIDRRAITVTTAGAAATIERAPFRISFSDGHGRTVLGETADAGRALAVAPPPAPLAPSFGPAMQASLYAPLAFTVGTEADAAQASGTYSGNLLSSLRAGTVYSAPGLFAYAVAHGLVARTAAGAPYEIGDSFGAPAALLDFTNPATLRWWAARIRAGLDLGADGFMQDFGEEVQPEMVFHDGETGLQMHNLYPVVYDRATRQILDAYVRRHPGRSVFFFTRAGYTARPGSTAYENANFPGDETTDWTRSSGIASIVPDMLNRAIGGAFGYTTDIGGYFDLHSPATTKELLLRWAELAVFTPFFRLHGSLIAGTHTPWRYGAQTVSSYDALSRLHERALGLILRLWRAADRSGIPPTRPLWLAYPGDGQAARQDQEWLLGPDLLVAPVVTAGASSRSVYFPAGCWRSPRTGQVVRGPQARAVAAPLLVLPYFVRCGSAPLAAR